MPETQMPDFVRPMLAQRSTPFDSDEYWFELKWDGMRAVVVRDGPGYRLFNRRGVEITPRYPEFSFLNGLPAGTILDGELVVLERGRPSLAKLLGRENVASPLKIRALSRSRPGHLIVFDQLYDRFSSILARPIEVRRECLQRTVETCDSSRLALSEAVRGEGRALFEEVVRRDLEGVMAKRLGSPYRPGKRSHAWLKIKRRSKTVCAIVGFQGSQNDGAGFRCLILAANHSEGLRYAGKVAVGFKRDVRQEIYELLCSRPARAPLVACPEPGQWVEAGLYCEVSYLEVTSKGRLRDPVFERLVSDPDCVRSIIRNPTHSQGSIR